MQYQSILQRSILPLLLFISLTIFSYSQIGATELSADMVTATTVHQSSENGISFTLNLASPAINDDGSIKIDGLDTRLADIGSPDLPYYQTHIALPPEAEARVLVTTDKAKTMTNINVAPVPQLDIPDDMNRMEITALEVFDKLYEPDETIYGSDQPYPSSLFEVSKPFYMRDRRVVALTLYPVQYNPVAQQLTSHQSFDVSVEFVGGNLRSVQPSSSQSNAFGLDLLNSAESAEWRALPRDLTTANTATTFPIGVETVKIEITEDAIYELSFDTLNAISSSFAGKSPSTLQMMHQGSPVAFEFIGDPNTPFQSGEKIRFYGWAFDGTRAEKSHVDTNVFWLWAGTSATNMTTVANLGSGTTLTSFDSTIVFEQDAYYLESNKTNWSGSDAGPELWFWQFFQDDTNTDIDIVLPHPTGSGTATYSAEVFASKTTGTGISQHRVTPTFSSVAGSVTSWTGNELKSVAGSVSGSQLNNGTNVLRLFSDSTGADANTRDDFHLNRITVTYERALTADSGQLQFDIASAGTHEMTVSGFSGLTADAVSVYDITTRLAPTEITIDAADIVNGATGVRIGRTNSANAKLIVGTPKAPANISTYTAESLDPNGGAGAKWVVVAPALFNSHAQSLATHRASYSSMTTFVADYEDIVNQYGYGYDYPAALRNYFQHGLTWATDKLEYVVLAGDATNNPLGRNCTRVSADSSICPSLTGINWQDATGINHIVTEFEFIDNIVGAVPTDYPMTLISGNDDVADVMLGRLPAQTTAEMTNMVNKIIRYENNLAANAGYMKNMLWLADNNDNDGSGDFCADTNLVRDSYVPSGMFNHKTLCLDDYLTQFNGDETQAKSQMRVDFANWFNINKAGILNYRGHGAPRDWGGQLITPSDLNSLVNFQTPTVVISADCLDGYFTHIDAEALSEDFIALGNEAGSAAHWSSVGLGFNVDHTELHKAFYTGLFEHDLVTIGAAIQFAKEAYIQLPTAKQAEVYEFLLQGDPAMHLPAAYEVYVPLVAK